MSACLEAYWIDMRDWQIRALEGLLEGADRKVDGDSPHHIFGIAI
tara:strand:+ start:487 stop:621 length:135 start_codon:yes stop_codon:yes gene_type:complete